MTMKHFAVASAALFTADAAFELGRIVLARPWPGVAPALSHLVSGAFALLALAAAAFQIVRLRDPRWASTAELLAIAGVVGMVLHGVAARVFGSSLGLGHFVWCCTE
jgi:hypothetical protein